MTENQRIKILRKEAGLSQIELAKQMGLDQSAISAVESGKNKATENFKILLSHIFGVTKMFIDTGEEPKYLEKYTVTPNHPERSNISDELLSQMRSETIEKERMYRELLAEKDKRLAEKDELIMVLKEQLAAKSKEAATAPDTRTVQG